MFLRLICFIGLFLWIQVFDEVQASSLKRLSYPIKDKALKQKVLAYLKNEPMSNSDIKKMKGHLKDTYLKGDLTTYQYENILNTINKKQYWDHKFSSISKLDERRTNIEAESRKMSSVYVKNQQIKTFLKSHCSKCHSDEKEEGEFNVNHLPEYITDKSYRKQWQDVLDALNFGDMPPEEEEQPSMKELTDVIGDLTMTLVKAKQRLP